ncbi:septum formation family protein [Nocardioides taihuensis]|uniref:Septum formation family protein n=1 Tax=Nocardioides taihuensis TaxID=1835606 RepID=A0ABW0BLM0_9ACTN
MPYAVRGSAVTLLAVLALAGCGDDPQGTDTDPAQVDAVDQPALGACRELTPDDVALPSNATKTVDCSEQHTAETFAVGTLPESMDDASYDDASVESWANQTCAEEFQTWLGADESLSMRTLLSWVWFRPSEQAWGDGARWYRCDVIGGSEESTSYVSLPDSTQGLLTQRKQDEWLVCADGPSVDDSRKVPCSEPHTWRAVTTIKLGEPDDPYPGDATVEATTRDYCSDSVGAWLGYPVDYDFGYTWFQAAEWQAGNRRSVCWAKTEK